MLLSENGQSNAAAAEAVGSALDQLTVRLMVGGIGPEFVTDLRTAGDEAGRSGLTVLSERIRALAESLFDEAQTDREQIFKTGITELCQMISNEKAGLPANSAPAYASLNEDAELIADFLVEAREHLSLIEGQLLSLERDPSEIETIHAVFRAFHTIKGLAGFLGFSVMQAVAHEVETLLDLARNEKIRIDTPIVDVVLASSDFLLGEMASIDLVLGGAPSAAPADNSGLIARIRSVAITAQAGDQKVPTPALAEVPSSVAEVPSAVAEGPTPATETETVLAGKGKAEKKKSAPAKTRRQSAAAPRGKQIAAVKTSESPAVEETQEEEDDFFKVAVATPPAPPAVTPAFSDKPEPAIAGTSSAPEPASVVVSATPQPEIQKSAKVAESTRSSDPVRTADQGSVRVETAKLDYLMDMVGEMVIAQSLIRHSQVLLSATDSRLIGDLSHLARVTAEVQRATMSMRMVPVAHLFQKIERVIRDLSRKAGKQVVLQTSGADTEVDKTVAEELSDPLLHMVRNSVDHGIEAADERARLGKPEIATIRLSAYHQGGQIVIEISDDGRGLNAEKIKAKAEQKEIIQPGLPLSESEIYQLIFAPGFSTAEKITDVSGRGVGMDVVRRNVEKLRGRIETQSELGKGTTFLLKLPLTLAIIDGLVVEVGNNHYIVPLSVVREIFRPLPSTLFSVEGREEMVLVREQLLPVVRLNQRLGITSRVDLPSDGLLVVIESENKLYCMLVDDLLGKQEVVIKSLGETFENASGFSGCAVLGDGRVGLILDTDGIYRGRRR